jgi:MSHA biogenesis protein MshK
MKGEMRRAACSLRLAFRALVLAFASLPPLTLADTLRDPTRPPIERSAAPAKASAPALRVEAILIDGARRVAVVDGKVVREGDRVGAALITAIEAGAIEYSRDGRKHAVKLRRTDKMAEANERRSNEDGT